MEAAAGIELDGQYRALREEAGFLDRSGRTTLLVHGTEAAELLQGQLTNEIEALAPQADDAPGQGCYAALLDRKGHMQADMRVLRMGSALIWIDAEPFVREPVLRHLSLYKVGREVEIEDATDRRSILSVIGPAADGVLAGIAGAKTAALLGGAEHANLAAAVADASCSLVRTDLGFDLLFDADAAAVRAELADAGVPEVSEAATEILRVESGRPRFGKEMTTATIPQEAGINERAVSFDKGCYIGQETVARLHYRGKPNRSLRGLRLEARAGDGDPVRLGDRELGAVGTAVISPARGPLALAILRREAEPGARVEVGDGVGAEVVELPF
jgi:tRNA-modifying protein YgfZ